MKKEIKKVIQQIPVKELREFVMQQIGEDPKNQIAFLRYFDDYFTEIESGDIYVEQVEDAFWNATIEDGRLSFSAQSHLSDEIYDVVEKVRKFISIGNP